MNQDQTMYSKIDAFLNGTLSKSEHADFEAEMAKNSSLQEKVADSRLANAAFGRMKLWEMKALTEEIDREAKQAQKIKKTVAIAAGLSLLIAAAVYLMISEKETRTEKSAPKPQTTSLVETPKVISSDAPAPSESKPVFKSEKKSFAEKTEVVPNQAKVEVSIQQNSTETSQKAIVPIAKQAIVAEQVVQKIEPKTPENACEKTKIEEVVFVEKSCSEQQTGRIQVSNIKGGTQPYQVTVLNEAKQTVSAIQLAGGHYSVLITDARNCNKTIENVVVKEMDCRKDFELNVSNGELFELDIVAKSAILRVYDQAGNTYFYKEFAKGERIQWDGIPTQGEARSGYFQFNVSYQEGESRMGSITVVN